MAKIDNHGGIYSAQTLIKLSLGPRFVDYESNGNEDRTALGACTRAVVPCRELHSVQCAVHTVRQAAPALPGVLLHVHWTACSPLQCKEHAPAHLTPKHGVSSFLRDSKFTWKDSEYKRVFSSP